MVSIFLVAFIGGLGITMFFVKNSILGSGAIFDNPLSVDQLKNIFRVN